MMLFLSPLLPLAALCASCCNRLSGLATKAVGASASVQKRQAACLRGLVVLCLAVWAGASAQASTVVMDVADAAGLPLAGAVVFLDSAEARKLVKPMVGVEVAQEKRKFLPSVVVVPVGTEVRFPNHDSVRHHVYSFSAAKNFELKLYSGTPSTPVLFDKPGVVVLGCNIHDQMVGWMLVVETPFYGLTPAAGGKVQLDNVPPGVYTLRTWHARLPVGAPAQEQSLVVPASGPVSVSVRLQGLPP